MSTPRGYVTEAPCPLCGILAEFQPSKTDKFFTCRVCGQFGTTFEFLDDIGAEVHPYLSAATRKAHEAGRPIVLRTDNWRALEEGQRSIRVSEKIARLLQLCAERSGAPGHTWSIETERDYPLVAARNPTELAAYLSHLVSRQLLTLHRTPYGQLYEVTVQGWQSLEPTFTPGGVPGRCFVAMWFDDSLDAVYSDGIELGVKDAGFTPYRVKEDPTNKGITDLVLSEIRRAQFVVADFTGHRNSVYYEAGFAQGIGREVIWCCREDQVGELTFDTRHLGHVVWKDVADLRLTLARSIQANIIPKR